MRIIKSIVIVLLFSAIGHAKEEGYSDEENKCLLSLARKGFPSVSKLTPDELRILAMMDPDGVREVLIRNIEIKQAQQGSVHRSTIRSESKSE